MKTSNGMDNSMDNSMDTSLVTLKVNEMLAYGKSLLGVKRGPIDKDLSYYYNHDAGPFWSVYGPVPDKSEVERQGVICTGFISLLMRKAHIPMPFLSHRPILRLGRPALRFGLADTDEWLFHYRHVVERFDPRSASYPKGTLLLRPYNPMDFGHMAILMEDATRRKRVTKCRVLHSIGVSLGGVPDDVRSDLVETHHWMYARGHTCEWDRSGEFDVKFCARPIGYYTHVLRPEYYVFGRTRPRLRYWPKQTLVY